MERMEKKRLGFASDILYMQSLRKNEWQEEIFRLLITKYLLFALKKMRSVEKWMERNIGE